MGFKVRIGDKIKECKEGTRLLDIAREFQSEYDNPIIMAVFNNKLKELSYEILEDGEVRFLTTRDKNGRKAYRRSVVFLLQQAVYDKYHTFDFDVHVYRSISGGYYCQLLHKGEDGKMEPVEINDELIQEFEDNMKRLVEENISIEKIVMKTSKARELFKEMNMPKKYNLLKYRNSSNINVYKLCDCYDYFYGFMVPSTGYLKNFKLELFYEGFMILFPDKKTEKIQEFNPSMKLCSQLRRTNLWTETIGITTVGDLNDAISKGMGKDLMLMQEALMEQYIGIIADKIFQDRSKKFVMIAGPSSSGKTTFSHKLTTQLRGRGLKPYPIPLDDYYVDRDKIPLDEFGEKDFECVEGIDIEQFNEDMLRLLNGERVLLPQFNFKLGKREYGNKYLQLGPEDVLVIEGIHGLNDKLSHSIPKESKYKIFISALTQLAIDEHNPLSTADARMIRRIVRDARTRGTDARGTIAMWDSVRRGEEKNIFPYQDEADFMVNSAAIYELSILKVYALPQLYAVPQESPEYEEANRLIKLLDYFLPMPSEDVPNSALLREFIGGSCYNV